MMARVILKTHAAAWVGAALLCGAVGAYAQSQSGNALLCTDSFGQQFLMQAFMQAPKDWKCKDPAASNQESVDTKKGKYPGATAPREWRGEAELDRLLGLQPATTPKARTTSPKMQGARLQLQERLNVVAQARLVLFSGGAGEAGLKVPASLARTAAHYDPLIMSAARKYGHEPNLLRAIMNVESRFNPNAVSPKGAIGLMQVMPATAQSLGVPNARETLFEPATNIDAGAQYLQRLATEFDGDLQLMVAAYNAGEGAVKRHNNAIPPYRETQNYVRMVIDTLDHLNTVR